MQNKIRNGRQWGDWQLDAMTLTLVLQSGRHHYEVYLNEIRDSADMLDWIFQLRMKAWATNEIIGDLISAFEDLFRPQTTTVGEASTRRLTRENGSAMLSRRIKKRAASACLHLFAQMLARNRKLLKFNDDGW